MNEQTYQESLQLLATKLATAEMVSAQYQALLKQTEAQKAELTDTLQKIQSVLDSSEELKTLFDETEAKINQGGNE
ncbi:hypothetical protein ACVRXQ_12145 [Streptococcus panodentis]|uniref:Uncharacterized protein n=1 Tax=Streptococcus panodentis TaxID=1581472 RepID=A0ABS5AX04_9STRE|nr:hypothetical protein [Streptococcus panodentis]MBP2621117.1 hypothetical protein [Streptococcus panodentis]